MSAETGLSRGARFFAVFLASAVLDFAIFLLVYAAKGAGNGVVYYSGLKTVALSLLVIVPLQLALIRALRSRWRGLADSAALSLAPGLIAYLLLGYSFVTTVPTMLDRSISIYLISALSQAGETGATLGALQGSFETGYVNGTYQLQKRLEEQLLTGNVERIGDRYRITSRGQAIQSINVRLALLLGLTDRYVHAAKPAEN